MVPEKTDISQQIRKYLAGELDARAMHELERRAQDDPFLMDALEGYQNIPVDENTGIIELNSRLQQRTAKKEARIISWRTMGIAASILILLGLGLFWYSERNTSFVMQKKIALKPLSIQKPVALPPDTVTDQSGSLPEKNATQHYGIAEHKDKLAFNKKTYKHAIIQMQSDAAAKASVLPPAVNEPQPFTTGESKGKDTTPLNEMVVMAYTAQKNASNPGQYNSVDSSLRLLPNGYAANVKSDTSGFKVMRIKGTDTAKLDERDNVYTTRAANQDMVNQNMLNYRPAHRNYDYPSTTRIYSIKRSGAGSIAPLNPVILHGKMVKGMVKESGEPVAYATVKIKGTNISTLTDSKGEFTLYAVPDSAILQVLAEGNVLKETKVSHRNMQVISIHLVVNTINYGAAIPPDDNGIPDNSRPRPSIGWADFDNYLHKNAVSPDGKKGVVKLSFIVNDDNSLSNFKIAKGIDTQTDNLAIKLVKGGPVWYSSSDDKPQAVFISIKFHQRKK